MLVEARKRIQAFENKCLEKLLRICYCEHEINDYERNKVRVLSLPLLTAGRCRGSITSHGVTASCKALLKADASGDGNTKAAQTNQIV